jgi:hypothetical protein
VEAEGKAGLRSSSEGRRSMLSRGKTLSPIGERAVRCVCVCVCVYVVL